MHTLVSIDIKYSHIYNVKNFVKIIFIVSLLYCKKTTTPPSIPNTNFSFGGYIDNNGILIVGTHDLVYLNNKTINPDSSFWDFGDGQYSSLNNPLPFSYDAPGKHTISLTTSDKDGGRKS